METELARAVDVMIARAKRIYNLMIKVKKWFPWCFLKEIKNMFSVFLSSYRNTRANLGELEKAVETLAWGSCSHSICSSPKLPLVLPWNSFCYQSSTHQEYCRSWKIRSENLWLQSTLEAIRFEFWMLRSFSDLGNVASYTFLLLKRTALKRTGTFRVGKQGYVWCFDVSLQTPICVNISEWDWEKLNF